MKIWLTSPGRSEIQLQSGPILEFDYPSQFPSTLAMFGDYIDPEYAFLQRIARPGWTVVDVGAAIGQFSIFAATCLFATQIHAFEPSSVNVATLGRNIVRNGADDSIRVHHAALSTERGTQRFATTPKTWMSQLLTAASGEEEGEVVAVETFDTIASGLKLNRVNILKINVAGYEPSVFGGAMQTLGQGKVDVMVLLLGLASLPYYAEIANLGYRFFYYHPKQNRLLEITKFDASSVLDSRPWPARHILAIRDGVVGELLAGRIAIYQ